MCVCVATYIQGAIGTITRDTIFVVVEVPAFFNVEKIDDPTVHFSFVFFVALCDLSTYNCFFFFQLSFTGDGNNNNNLISVATGSILQNTIPINTCNVSFHVSSLWNGNM